MGVSGGVWECGKPERFSIISMPQSEGEKGEVTYEKALVSKAISLERRGPVIFSNRAPVVPLSLRENQPLTRSAFGGESLPR